MAEIVFHPEAQTDYQGGLARYRARSDQAATGFEAEMDRIVGMIATFPEMYPPYDEEHRFAVLRRYPYSIIYQVQSDRVWVVAVAHSARPQGYWQGRT